MTNQNELYHYGVKGMRWGIRRYQNYDGEYTRAGVRKYEDDLNAYTKKKNEYDRLSKKYGRRSNMARNAKSQVRALRKTASHDKQMLRNYKVADKGAKLIVKGETVAGHNKKIRRLAFANIAGVASGYAFTNNFIAKNPGEVKKVMAANAILLGASWVSYGALTKLKIEKRQMEAANAMASKIKKG